MDNLPLGGCLGMWRDDILIGAAQDDWGESCFLIENYSSGKRKGSGI